jgi:adenine-specific DNA-methyltransferase
MTITRLRPSFTFTEERLAELRAVVPEAFADGRVNWEALREALSEWTEPEGEGAEHFGLFWPGKREARRLAAKPSRGTLVPVPGEGVNEETTRNLFIEGDNLEVLKLLQKSYAGRVKMIYIDPPYNTGNDFVYKDDFSDPLDDYLRKSGQADEAGDVLTTNTRADGRFHSNWLSMMYPRLRLARNLLSDDGVIFISIDDNEVHHLRSIMSELFGEENFVAQICHKARASVSNDKIISSSHNHILLFARNVQRVFEDRRMFGLTPTLEGFDMTDERGAYKLVPVDGPGGARKGNPYYEFLGVEGYFRFSRDTMQRMHDEGLIVKRGNSLQQKYYRSRAESSRRTDTTWWDEGYYTSTATSRLNDLLDASVFENPKPVELIQRMLELWARDDDLILDFFAGSGSTAHAVLGYNGKATTRCQWILVQMPEVTAPDSEARQHGFDRISDIGKERIRRVIKKLSREQRPTESEDLGFRVLRLVQSHLQAWEDYEGDGIEQVEALFEDAETPLVKGWAPEALLTEVLLLQGFPLDARIESQSALKRNDVHLVTSHHVAHRLWVCLDSKLHDVTVAALAPSAEDVVVCLDSALSDGAKLRLADRCTLETI